MINTYVPEGMRLHTAANKEALSSVEALERACYTGQVLEAPALLCDNRMRLHVDLGCMRGIMDREEALWCRPGESIKDIAVITRVGKPIAFRILRFEEKKGERVAILSRRAVQGACVAEFLSTLRPGDIIPARVTHLENYGAFVDIGCGISSLLSIDCISISRITHPRERLACGMQILVAVKSIDTELKRIFVTMKELLGTWEENAARFEAGQTVMGRVRSIESYGIFVELAPNLAGLAELRGSNGTPAATAVGDLAAVYIKSILPERMKIKLVIIDSRAEAEFPETPKYFIDPEETPHLDRWEYSPASSLRLIETVF
ncbi:MAG: 30S ribosomal protein S1 [Ruminococcaceae bacterium]|nr:30S ribosomal protein S1 [Oscillospiraceae bacterium]